MLDTLAAYATHCKRAGPSLPLPNDPALFVASLQLPHKARGLRLGSLFSEKLDDDYAAYATVAALILNP